jgi:uncharacterized cupredoxin-like copper-binding protein
MSRSVSLAALSALVLLAGCGGGGGSSSSGGGYGGGPAAAKTTAKTTASATAGGGGQTVKLAAAASGLRFDTTSLNAKPGKVTLAMMNPQGSGIPHGIAVEGNGIDRDGQVVQGGGTSTVQVTLKPGKYTFYCPVPGHRAAGMVGTLTVN